MPLAVCPFCDSGDTFMDCTCRYALHAQRYGLVKARAVFAADGAKRAPAKPFSEMVAEKVSPLKKPRRSKPAPAAPAPPAPIKVATTAPWLAPPGECASCDRRRAAGVDANKRAREQRRSGRP